jgi:hypothetical protein
LGQAGQPLADGNVHQLVQDHRRARGQRDVAWGESVGNLPGGPVLHGSDVRDAGGILDCSCRCRDRSASSSGAEPAAPPPRRRSRDSGGGTAEGHGDSGRPPRLDVRRARSTSSSTT